MIESMTEYELVALFLPVLAGLLVGFAHGGYAILHPKAATFPVWARFEHAISATILIGNGLLLLFAITMPFRWDALLGMFIVVNTICILLGFLVAMPTAAIASFLIGLLRKGVSLAESHAQSRRSSNADIRDDPGCQTAISADEPPSPNRFNGDAL